MCEQGPAWEAQCHADTHLMLSTLQALPLQPDAASGTVEHLTQLCLLRFADPSPSGYTIPGQLPSPVSYSSASQGSTPGTANSLATAHGAPSPSAGRQLQQVASVPVIKYLPSPVSVFCTLPVHQYMVRPTSAPHRAWLSDTASRLLMALRPQLQAASFSRPFI